MNALVKTVCVLGALQLGGGSTAFQAGAYGPERRLWVQIDTLVGASRVPESGNALFLPVVGSPDAASDGAPVALGVRPQKQGIQYGTELLLPDTCDGVDVLVNAQQDKVRLTGVRRLSGDTLRIARWEIFRDSLYKEVRGSEAFYYDDTDLRRPLVLVDRVPFRQDSGDSTLGAKRFQVQINNRSYEVHLDTVCDEQRSMAHGRVTLQKFVRAFALDRKKYRDRWAENPVLRLVVQSRTRQWHYKGVVQLQP